MKSNLVGVAAWVILGLIGLVTTVDLGFGPIVICPQCGSLFNTVLGVVLIAISIGAIITNRSVMAQR